MILYKINVVYRVLSMRLAQIGRSSALAALKKLTDEGVILRQGSGRGTYYVRADSMK